MWWPIVGLQRSEEALEPAKSSYSRKRKSISLYISEALAKNPHLADADVFAYREYVQQNPPQAVRENDDDETETASGFDLPKCSQRANDLQRDGNLLFLHEKYTGAVMKFNESLCWAPGDSEELAQGYAARSAVLYAMGFYELCLEDLATARRLPQSHRLLPILQDRELKCRQKIASNERKPSKPCPKLPMNVEVNPKVPTVANGIAMDELPHYGRCMMAEKDFKTGDVILHEKPLAIVVRPKGQFLVCCQCGSEKMSLLPCPHCVAAMFCSEECLEKGWNESHRFECGIWDKLSVLRIGAHFLGPRMFFYGLTLFKDNVEEMMAYCKANGRTTVNPFNLDKQEPMDAFKAFHTTKVLPLSVGVDKEIRFTAAILHSIYMEHSLVKSLFVEEAEQNFLLQTMYEYMITALRLNIGSMGNFSVKLYTIASLCNHSCYPNVTVVERSGHLKFIAIRPIGRSEQISINYVPIFNFDGTRRLSVMGFECECEVCMDNESWQKNDKPLPSGYRKHWQLAMDVQKKQSCTLSDKLNALQQFIQRYANVQPMFELLYVITSYRSLLLDVFANELMCNMREDALSRFKLT